MKALPFAIISSNWWIYRAVQCRNSTPKANFSTFSTGLRRYEHSLDWESWWCPSTTQASDWKLKQHNRTTVTKYLTVRNWVLMRLQPFPQDFWNAWTELKWVKPMIVNSFSNLSARKAVQFDVWNIKRSLVRLLGCALIFFFTKNLLHIVSALSVSANLLLTVMQH